MNEEIEKWKTVKCPICHYNESIKLSSIKDNIITNDINFWECSYCHFILLFKKDKLEKKKEMDKEITIIETTEHNCHIFGDQSKPQDTMLSLDPIKRTIKADYNSDNSINKATILEYAVSPFLTAEALNRLMKKLRPLLNKVCDSYQKELQSGNNMKNWTNEDLEFEIEDYITDFEYRSELEDDLVHVYEASEWFKSYENEIQVRMAKGEKPEDIVKDYLKIDYGELLILDLGEYIKKLKRENQ